MKNGLRLDVEHATRLRRIARWMGVTRGRALARAIDLLERTLSPRRPHRRRLPEPLDLGPWTGPETRREVLYGDSGR